MSTDPSRAMTLEEHTARRAAITADLRARTGIDEAMIERLVRAFYERIQADPLLGPVFADRITDWEPHLQRMFAFWSSVTLMTGVYHGRPMQKHMNLAVDAQHFDRWLELFRETAAKTCPPVAATYFVQRAELIAQSIELGLATVNGVMLRPGQRYHAPA